MQNKVFDLPILGQTLLNRVCKHEGGDKLSATLRDYYKKKYNVDVGLYTYGGCFEPRFNVGGRNVHIGRYCSFAANTHYFGANHPVDSAVMSAYFYNSKFGNLKVEDVERQELTIGHDVWVGYGANILSSCKNIGNGSVIAAGAVVTKDVPAYAIVAGVPAKIIRYRFDQDIQNLLEESRWWKLSPQELYIYYDKIKMPREWANKIIAQTKTL